MTTTEGEQPNGEAESGRGSGVFAASREPARRGEVAAGSGIVMPEAAELRPAAGAAISFTDHGGVVLQHVHVQLIFWGGAWISTAGPTMGAVTDAVVNMLAGPYMSALNQYRNIGSGLLHGATLVSAQVGTSPANPPNPFSNTDIETLIRNLIGAGRVPAPAADAQLFYAVILPRNVNTNQSGVIGEHTFFTYSGKNAHYAWVLNFGTAASVTTIFSHELVETCTDPEGSAILGQAGTCSQGGWCEIGDVCSTTSVVNGVTVQSYWSQRDGACIVPNAKYAKDHKDTKDTKDKENKEHKETKDHKDQKDHKETKDGAKEKDKDAKEKETDNLSQLSSMVGNLTQRVDELGQRLDALAGGGAVGEPFIRPGERPEVGEQALTEEEEPSWEAPETPAAPEETEEAPDAEAGKRGRKKPSGSS